MAHIPDDGVPASIITRHDEFIQPQCTSTPQDNLQEGASNYINASFPALSASSLVGLGHFLYNVQLYNGTMVTNGSYSGDTATFAFLAQPLQHDCSLTQVELRELTWGSGFINGSLNDKNSCQAELAVILAAINFADEKCRAHNINHGKCVISCNSKGTLLAAFGTKCPTPRWASYDLLW